MRPTLKHQFVPRSSVPPPHPRHNLPAALSSFVGREDEVANLRARLLGAARLVTLIGPGGCGKTRLALEASARSIQSFPDGVWFVELAPLVDPRLVPQAVASTLGVRADQGQALIRAITSRIAGQRMLIILDTCEHVLASAAETATALLSTCPGLQVLATSRQALRLAGEIAWPVPPLAEAPRLFAERAAEAMPGFGLTPRNRRAVTEICRRVDGLPLALELAAAWVRTLPPEQILERLVDRFRLLAGAAGSTHPRHLTLKATMDWSYDLLAPSEKILLGRLAVFSGAFGLEAAEAVGSSDGLRSSEVLTLLDGLVAKSLVVAATSGTSASFRLLNTVREYAGERLSEVGAEPTRRRHAEHFALMVDKGLSEDAIQQVHDDCRAALDWATTADPDLALRLAAALGEFWQSRVHLGEGRRRIELALTMASGPAEARGKALDNVAAIAWRQGDYQAAQSFLVESVSLAQQLGDQAAYVYRVGLLADVLMYSGDPAGGRPYAEIAVREARKRAQLRQDASPRELSEQRAHDQQRLCRLIGEIDELAGAMFRLGRVIYNAGGDRATARVHLDEALAIWRDRGEVDATAPCLLVLGTIAIDDGRLDDARVQLMESMRLRRAQGDRFQLAAGVNHLGLLAAAAGQPERALRLGGAAEAMHEINGSQSPAQLRKYIARWFDTARRSLGRRAAAAWREGRELEAERAIAYALEEEAYVPTTPLAAESSLSARERQVAAMLAAGQTNRQIATRLGVSIRTVDAHVEHMRNKLGFHSRAEIATWVARRE